MGHTLQIEPQVTIQMVVCQIGSKYKLIIPANGHNFSTEIHRVHLG
jgi:hypothetical protein